MQKEIIHTEIKYKAVKSSGPGGQHVNKTATKVEASFDLLNSKGLSVSEKEQLLLKISTKLTSENILILTSSQTRSQLKNKKLVTQKLLNLLEENCKKPKSRKKTKPSKLVIKKRLESKRKHAFKKASRKKPPID